MSVVVLMMIIIMSYYHYYYHDYNDRWVCADTCSRRAKGYT
jgi:hypothetical protein